MSTIKYPVKEGLCIIKIIMNIHEYYEQVLHVYKCNKGFRLYIFPYASSSTKSVFPAYPIYHVCNIPRNLLNILMTLKEMSFCLQL